MNKRIVLLLAIACILGLLSWSVAQNSKTELFDARKAQQELEIMRGILSTTLGIVTKELRGPSTTRPAIIGEWRFSNIGAFYLYGQGATFTIPLSSFRGFFNGRLLGTGSGKGSGKGSGIGAGVMQELEQAKEDLRAEASAIQAEADVLSAQAAVAEGVRGGILGGVAGGVPGGVPAPQAVQPPPPPPPSPAAPAPTPAKQEELRKKLAEVQEQVKKRREEVEKQSQKLQEFLSQLKSYLIEALANYGDSLTVVKPNEYINLVITTDSDGYELLDRSSSLPAREIISVQRSVITDYKAGRITLDVFKQKVLQYNE